MNWRLIITNLAMALCFGSTVFFFRVDQAFRHGSHLPVNDQWATEYVGLYKKYVEQQIGIPDLFAFSNEHIVALQKIAHLGLFLVLGEWNILAQLMLNAFLFSILVSATVFFAGYKLAFPFNYVIQAMILLCGLLPIAAQNYLWGFQTGWYFYYFTSFVAICGLYFSRGFDRWWSLAFVSALMSCLCLAAGMVNLLICSAYPGLSLWFAGTRRLRVFKSLGVGGILLLVPLGFFGSRFLTMRSDAGLGFPIIEHIVNGLAVFSFPLFFIPITYIPFYVAAILLLRWRLITGSVSISFGLILGVWAFLHAITICVGRSEFGGRHSELILIGIIANAVIIAEKYSSEFFRNTYVLKKSGFQIFVKPLQLLCLVWFAAIFGGLVMQSVRTAGYPELFSLDASRRNEVLTRVFSSGNIEDLEKRNHSFVPNFILLMRPELILEETLTKVLPSFYRRDLILDPAVSEALLQQTDSMFPEPFPFLPWIKLQSDQQTRKITATASNIKTRWAKLSITGRAESPETGIYLQKANGTRVKEYASFSQPDQWRTVFLPVVNSQISFTAIVAGPFDWLLIQQPICISEGQYFMEAGGRLSRYFWAVALGASVFVYCVAVGVRVVKYIKLYKDDA